MLHHAAHLLPAQGPIGVFVHHNTLHAFQHLPFEEAVVKASEIFGTEPYMSEAAYRRDLARGRIREEDLDAILASQPDSDILPDGRLTINQLRRVMLSPGLRQLDPRSIEWQLEEGDWKRVFRRDLSEAAKKSLGHDTPAQLWDACFERVLPHRLKTASRIARPRDGILATQGVDLDEVVHPLLIRLCSVFLDQGLAYWPMPEREKGFWGAALTILLQPLTIYPRGLEGLGETLASFTQRRLTSEEAILACMEEFGVAESEWESFVEAQLLALPGWAGMFHRLEAEPGLAPHVHLPYALADFLAVRLVLTLGAVKNVLRSPAAWRTESTNEATERTQRLCETAALFDAAQLSGVDSATLRSLSDEALEKWMSEIRSFDGIERRRTFHLAYERRHERQILIPLAKHLALPAAAPQTSRLAAQVFFCIDEREESIRRHLEEIDPEIDTFGAAGFFGVAVDYTGMDDAHGAPLCPVVVTPQHEVLEKAVGDQEDLHRRRRALRRLWAKFFRNGFISSRTLVRGWISTATLGFFSVFPLALRVLSPLAHARLIAWLNKAFLPEPRTELTFERQDDVGREAAEGLLRGFAVEEKVNCVASVLGPAGLHKGMARIAVVLGHGSTSLNNPHESAHDCGACGGRRGGPNARLFAAMANHPKVREGLVSRGIIIPDDTWFVGGYHDTCNDDIEFFDLDAVPEDHLADLDRVRASLDEARARSAHERARRFEAAKPDIDFQRGLLHVQERAEHLGEPRPEYGHCTNAVCIVGRRETTRGLFFDRRAFLVSYDAGRDPTNENLGRVLGAVIPVCGGINLEYYFSFVDNERYGCGTKLPHNVTGLVGVMNGYQSDLRTGLPWQMVEIHEPVRILFVVETTPERVLASIRANPQLDEFLTNRWIRLATQDPDTGVIHICRDGVFEKLEGDEEPLPVAPSSKAWYGGKIEHLPVARIEQPNAPKLAV
ncbi:MAG: DUF2309 domain-containing protein [Verrucomicrobiales bacterium]|nr:DUF2309 domain-containing protein [Verrucomicrobiales bacterium]